MVKRDINAFRERFNRWKNGELVYDKGRVLQEIVVTPEANYINIGEFNPNKYPVVSSKDEGLDDWFKSNTNVTGMAIGGGENGIDGQRRIVHNPYLINMENTDSKWKALDKIEAVRHYMSESNYYPTFNLTNELKHLQKTLYKNTPYGKDDIAFKKSIISRLVVGDESNIGTPTSLQLKAAKKFIYPRYKDGKDGENNPSLDSILRRATRVYNNYSDAKDFNMNPFIYGIRKTLNNAGLKSGISNCTLCATLWIDPKNPIKSAATIFDPNGNSGYYRISEDEALPGDLLITKNPERGSYHTMLIESYDKNNKPVLRYSTGGPTNDSLRTGVSLDAYHQKDNDQGGNHTEDHYFRYGVPIYTSMKPVIIKPANNNFLGFRGGKDENADGSDIPFGDQWLKQVTVTALKPLWMRKQEYLLHPELWPTTSEILPNGRVRGIGMSGADPIGELVVSNAVLNPAFKLIGKAALYGLGRAGNNWARAKLISSALDKSSIGSRSLSVTPESMDAAYEAAVRSGNRPEALRLLEQAYLNSGIPKNEITVTPEGNAVGWYHGSEWGNHTIFNSSAMNATIGGSSAAGKVKGNFLTTDVPSGKRYAGANRFSPLEAPEFTEPQTFTEKVQNLFGKYKQRRLYPAERVGEYAPKPERLFDTEGKAPINHLDKTDNVVYPLYVNPGNNVMKIDFQGNPWSKSPIEFPNRFYIKRNIRDDIAKTYRDEIIPYDSYEEAYKAWVEDPINIMRDQTILSEKYFDDGIRSIEGWNSRPRYENVRLIEERIPNTTNGAVQTAAKNGNTSVLMRNVIDSNGGPEGTHYAIDDFVTLRPEQLKLADITYDDAGNLIPLSQRFNWSNPDIRYSWLPWLLGGSSAAALASQKGYVDGKDSGIHIKPSHRGRLTALKKRTGKSEAELYRTGGPAVRKMITFARNARKWHHN